MATKARIRPGDGDPRHGTPGGYTNLRCRCQACRDAHTSACLRARRRRIERGLDPEDGRHGRANTYTNWGCRCGRCTAAWSASKRVAA
jgi:hypothetical protein